MSAEARRAVGTLRRRTRIRSRSHATGAHRGEHVVLSEHQSCVVVRLQQAEEVLLGGLHKVSLRSVAEDVHVPTGDDGAARRRALGVLHVRLLEERSRCRESVNVGRPYERMPVRA